jgi:hypothetical protein
VSLVVEQDPSSLDAVSIQILNDVATSSISTGQQIQRWYFRLSIRLDGPRFPEPVLHRERIRRSTVLMFPLTSPTSSSASPPYRATWSSPGSAFTAESKLTVLGHV